MNITKMIYVVISSMILFFLVSKILIVNNFFFLLTYFDIVFYFLCFLFFCYFFGRPRNKNYLKKVSIRYIIMLLLSYVLIIYMLGLFMGFTKSIYSFNVASVFLNLIPIVIMIFSKEYIRFIVANKCYNNILPYVYLTLAYCIFDIFNAFIMQNEFNSFYQIFNFICLTVLPTFAKEAVSSYITYNISYTPTLIYNLSFAIFPYVVPLYPDLGDYLNSILGIGFPFIIFLTMRKWIKYKDIDNIKLTNSFIKLICMPLIIFTSILVILISGVFSYKLIAIGSDSMNPIYYKGDAIIYKKVDIGKIKKDDILVFEHNNQVITHRVVGIIKKGNRIYFQTKGDNNEDVDAGLISSDMVLGTVRYIVKYVGYPTIWLNEFFT